MGLGVAIITVCAVATVATGGACGFAYAIASNALKGAIWGAVQGAIGGLVNGAVEYYEENGTLDGSGQHLLKSTAQGFVEGTFSGTIDGVGSGALQFAKSPNSFCFIGGTIVLTSKGYKAIEEIRIGDKVLATDPETGETTEKTVLQTFERQTTEFVDVTIGGETYTTTPEHPFYVEGKDFVNASELEVGDKVVCYDTETDITETKEVEEVHNYETDEPVTVYNFEVHDYHTYHVGEDGVLVHNGCKKAGGSSGSGNGNSGKNPSGEITSNSTSNSSVETPINSGTARPRDQATPNSIYEQLNADGTVKSRAFYDERGNVFNRQDFDHKHFDKKTQQYYQPHEHSYHYNSNGFRDGVFDGPLTPGYTNKATR